MPPDGGGPVQRGGETDIFFFSPALLTLVRGLSVYREKTMRARAAFARDSFVVVVVGCFFSLVLFCCKSILELYNFFSP